VECRKLDKIVIVSPTSLEPAYDVYDRVSTEKEKTVHLKFMEQQPLTPSLMTCPHCEASDRIGIHSPKERRYICHHCRRTFAETTGTVFYGLHYPIWVIVVIVTLLAHGCPVPAIVTAFCLDERTVRLWWDRAGEHGKALQEQLVCQGSMALGQVQLDELCVTTQDGKIWVATAMSVFSRLFLWGDVSKSRDSAMVMRVLSKVKDAASSTTQAIVFAVDGFAAYPKAILKTFYTKAQTGRPGRPKHLLWPNLHIVQVIKSRQGKRLKEVTRQLCHGQLSQVYALIHETQVGPGRINTAFIERLNATFRSRMPSVVRRTRRLARTPGRLDREMFWSGVVYNFCTVHQTLQGTPAMAAGLVDEVWSVERLLRYTLPTT
jgi:transposase-like protein